MTTFLIIFWAYLISFFFNADAEKVIMVNFVLCIYLLYYFISESASIYFQSKKTTLHELLWTAVDLQINALKIVLDRIYFVNNYVFSLVSITITRFCLSINAFLPKFIFKSLVFPFYLKFYNLFLVRNINFVLFNLSDILCSKRLIALEMMSLKFERFYALKISSETRKV